jgi:hypothetical protein
MEPVISDKIQRGILWACESEWLPNPNTFGGGSFRVQWIARWTGKEWESIPNTAKLKRKSGDPEIIIEDLEDFIGQCE